MTTFGAYRAACPDRLDVAQERRPANALNVEYMTPTPRCRQQSPDGRGSAWLWSGGSPLAYGTCCRLACPQLAHRRDAAEPGAPLPTGAETPDYAPATLIRRGTPRVLTSVMRFNGTIEFLPGQRAAIVTLTDSRGEWAGSSRITGRDLYEVGYTKASQNAAVKGGSLETYKVAS